VSALAGALSALGDALAAALRAGAVCEQPAAMNTPVISTAAAATSRLRRQAAIAYGPPTAVGAAAGAVGVAAGAVGVALGAVGVGVAAGAVGVALGAVGVGVRVGAVVAVGVACVGPAVGVGALPADEAGALPPLAGDDAGAVLLGADGEGVDFGAAAGDLRTAG
jgi:type IV secretion system protein TrbL